MSFGSPYYLLWLIPLAVAAWFVYRQRVRQALVFAPFHRLPAARATWRTRLRPLAPIFYLSGIALAIIALARPHTVFSRTVRRSDAIAIQMVVDCSGSMQALDFAAADNQRTRLDVVKETFAKFIAARPGDLIGLITFGGFASSRVPLTLDHDALLHSLQGVQTAREQFNASGQLLNQEEMLTAIGDALATACARQQDAAVKSKIIVLLSDGESNTGIIKPENAAKAAKALGMKVYTIGVGTTGTAPFLGRDMFGRPAIGPAEVRLDEDLLRGIAQTTGGQYFNVTDTEGFSRVMEKINKLEKTTINTDLYTKYDEHFLYFLLSGLALVCLGAVGNAWLGKHII